LPSSVENFKLARLVLFTMKVSFQCMDAVAYFSLMSMLRRFSTFSENVSVYQKAVSSWGVIFKCTKFLGFC